MVERKRKEIINYGYNKKISFRYNDIRDIVSCGIFFLIGRDRKVNLNGISKKLQRAILQTGLIIKYSQRQFYSAEQNRLINIYILSTPALGRDRHGEWKEKDLELIRTTSQLEIVNCLKDIWDEVKT